MSQASPLDGFSVTWHPGVVSRVVGDALFYVDLAPNEGPGFHPRNILIGTVEKSRPYRGERFRELGIIEGMPVCVNMQGHDQGHARVLIDPALRPGVFRRLRYALHPD